MSPRVLHFAVPCLLLGAPLVRAEEPESPQEPPWRLEAGVSLVATSGNSDTSSAGLDLSYDHGWDQWALDAEGKGLRATEQGETTAERYAARVRGKRRLSRSFQLTVGARGERDRFAGIAFRSVVDGSLQWSMASSETFTASALAGLSWSHEKRTDGVRNFAGGVAELKARRALSATSALSGRAAYLPSFETAGDYRLEGRLALQASVISRLALKLSYEIAYTSRPPVGFKTTDSALNASLVMGLGHDARD